MINSTRWTAFVSQNHASPGAPPPQSGWTTQFNRVYQVCQHCMLTQSTQLRCSRAWALAFTQTHNQHSLRSCRSHISAAMTVRICAPLNPPCAPPLACFRAGVCWKPVNFFSQNLLYMISHIWVISWENCPFSSKWNYLWCLKASLAIKGLNTLSTMMQCSMPRPRLLSSDVLVFKISLWSPSILWYRWTFQGER